MSTLVETKSASIDTLSVTIKALHVSGKQMTLAVFRQLPECHVFNKDGSFDITEYWGIVRYHIKDEGSLWAVRAVDGVLYRCDIDEYLFKSKLNTLKHGKQRIYNSISYIEEQNKSIAATESIYILMNRIHPYGVGLKKKEDGNYIFYDTTDNGLQNELLDIDNDIKTAEKNLNDLKTLTNLPQLFIAV